MLPGLADPTLDSQRIFRGLLEAMARPGRIVDMTVAVHAPPPLHAATAGICLTLLDGDTPLWIDGTGSRPEVVDWVKFHCGAPIVDRPGEARFGLVTAAERMPPPSVFDAGTAERPDRSATLIVQVTALLGGTGRRLTGPGIADEARLEVDGVPAPFWGWIAANHALFPQGVDIVMSAGRVVAALPRTTRVEA